MSKDQLPPVFLERRSYRQRRMLDAVRILPVFGTLLWLLPLFWPTIAGSQAGQVSLSGAVTYVFGVWLFLIVCSLLLSRSLRHTLKDNNDPAGGQGPKP